MSRWRSVAVGVFLCVAVAPVAHAQFGVWFGPEQFRWREFDDSGSQLLEETGWRHHVGADWRRSLSGDNRTELNVRGSLYLGRVAYDGLSCKIDDPSDCSPFNTDTEYYGAEAGAIVARRFGEPFGGEVFGGGGLDNWRRHVKGRGSVRGAIEDWTTLYAVGGGGAYWDRASMRHSARIGVKYPFYTLELPDAYDVELNPEGKPALFVRLATDFLSNGRPSWGIGAYWDRYRFDASDKERDGAFLIWQPESHQDVFGLFVTLYLF